MPRKITEKKDLDWFARSSFTEDREAWKKELQRQCAEVCVGILRRPWRNKRGEKYRRHDKDEHFTEDCRTAKITKEFNTSTRKEINNFWMMDGEHK